MAGKATGVEVARISVKVSPNTKEFRRELKRDLDNIEKSLRATVDVEANLNRAGAAAQMRELMTQLRAQGLRGVEIETHLDRDTLRRGLSSLAGGLAELGGEAESAGASFASMGRTGWIAVGLLAAAAPVIGLVSGLLAGLPSVLSAVAVPMGAVALGLDGIKAAAQTIAPQFDSLKASISGLFQTGLTPVFQQMAGIFPQIQQALGPVVTGLTGLAQAFTNVITDSAGVDGITETLANVGKMLQGLQPFVSTFTDSLITLSAVGSSAFGMLTGPLNTFATQFNDVVNRLTSSGAFNGAMQGLSQVLGSVLTLFNQLFESGVNAMGQLGGPLSNMIGGLGNAFVAMMPALTSFSGLIGNVFGELFNQLAPIITELTPGFTQLASALGTTLVGALQALGPALVPVATSLSNAVLGALQQLAPVLPSLVQSFVQLGQAIGQNLAQTLPTIATAFGQLLGVLARQGPILLEATARAFTAMLPAMTALAPFVAQLATQFSNFMTRIEPMLPTLANLAVMFVQVSAAVGGALVGSLTLAANGFVTIATAVGNFVSAVVNGVNQAVQAVASLGGQIASAVSNFGSLLVEAGKNLIQGLINGIKSMAGAALNAAKEIGSSVVNGVKGLLGINSPSKVFEEIGQFVGEGFNNGLLGQRDQLSQTAKDMAADVSAGFRDGLNMDLSGAGAGAGVGKKNDNPFVKAAAGMMAAPVDFAKATGQQFLSDIGISGEGFISKALTEGANYVFNIQSIDEAMAVKQRQEHIDAMSTVGARW